MAAGSTLAQRIPEESAQEARVPLVASNLKPEDKARVLVLGSPHLGQFPAETKWEGLDAVRDALARYQPDLIAVESLAGDVVESYEGAAPRYDDILQTFAPDTLAAGRAARRRQDTKRRSAAEEAYALVATFRGQGLDSVAAEQRRRAVLLLAAAYDLPSAALQWSYLSPQERAGDGVSTELVNLLNRYVTGHNEIVELGVATAMRMNLQRLYGVDDQSDALFQVDHGQQLMAELSETQEFARLPESMLFRELPQRMREHAAAGTLLEFFRWMNSTAYGRADVDAQWHLFYRTRLASGLDRRRAALWEVRNLRIAAHIRAAIAECDARRALVIIGASHKPFLEAYLRTLMDVRIVDAASALER